MILLQRSVLYIMVRLGLILMVLHYKTRLNWGAYVQVLSKLERVGNKKKGNWKQLPFLVYKYRH